MTGKSDLQMEGQASELLCHLRSFPAEARFSVSPPSLIVSWCQTRRKPCLHSLTCEQAAREMECLVGADRALHF